MATNTNITLSKVHHRAMDVNLLSNALTYTNNLGITVGSDSEMSPRSRITTSGYSLVAEKAIAVIDGAVPPSGLDISGSSVGQVIGNTGTRAEWTSLINVPIGSIIPWAKNMTGVPVLPEGWVECDGLEITDLESPMDGESTPDLNGQNRFLRGAANSGLTGGSDTHRHKTPIKYDEGGYFLIDTSGVNRDYNDTGGGDYTYGNTFGSRRADGGTFLTHYADGSPPFYEVVWIIRIK